MKSGTLSKCSNWRPSASLKLRTSKKWQNIFKLTQLIKPNEFPCKTISEPWKSNFRIQFNRAIETTFRRLLAKASSQKTKPFKIFPSRYSVLMLSLFRKLWKVKLLKNHPKRFRKKMCIQGRFCSRFRSKSRVRVWGRVSNLFHLRVGWWLRQSHANRS